MRVAAYCRVSTDKEDQRNSLETQRQFFEAYIRNHPDWTPAGIFADEGLSGTSAHRPAFHRMLTLAESGALDLIVTKEVSRFARNTVDTLQLTRTLKAKGVGVLFLNDNIDTRDNDGEFRLTIMASVAQEESRKISERTRWGQTQALQRGVVFGNNSLYGYTLRGGELTLQPEQAKVVQEIYRKFLYEGKGTHVIARELTQAGIDPPLGSGSPWSSTAVLRILKNEKYCGDLLQRKYVTTDYLSHKKIPNDGREETFLLRDHHVPILPREEFEAVRLELEKRRKCTEGKQRYSGRYWFSGKVICGRCGKSFTVKRTKRANGREYCRFLCRGSTAAGTLGNQAPCTMRGVNGAVIEACAKYVLGQLAVNWEKIAEELLSEVGNLPGGGEPSGGEQRFRQALKRQKVRKERAWEAYLDGTLTKEEWTQISSRCHEECHRLTEEARKWAVPQQTRTERLSTIRKFLEAELRGGPCVLGEVIEKIVVYEDRFEVSVQDFPVKFRICAAGRGMGRQYRIVVERCEPIPIGEEEKKCLSTIGK